MTAEPPARLRSCTGLAAAARARLPCSSRTATATVSTRSGGSALIARQCHHGLAELAARLDPYASLTAKTSAEAAAWAIGWLQAHDGWLLVLDDATPRSIEPVLGTLAGGRHLITSRRATGWHRVARPLPLAVLPPDAALDLLMQVISPGRRRRPGTSAAACRPNWATCR